MNGRFTRQSRLTEIGARGQAAIEASDVHLGHGGVAGAVAARYLAGAGVRRIHAHDAGAARAAASVDASAVVTLDSDRAAEPLPAAFLLEDPAARAVAEGAHDALVVLKAVLGIGPASRP